MNQHHEDHIMPQVVIRAQQLSKQIQLPEQQLSIFQSIDLTIYAGEHVAITGRSGSGKSTLLGILATLDHASSGTLELCGKMVQGADEEACAQLRLDHIGFVFQSFQLLPHLTALENVLLPLRLSADFSYPQAKALALSLLAKVGLERQALQTPQVLSGGEQQRVAIARALIRQPEIIFADEPTGNLDAKTAHDIEQLLFTLNREMGTTLILVTHDQRLADQCQRHLQLCDGQLLELLREE